MLTYQSTKSKTICPYCSSTAVSDNTKEDKEIICPNENCKKHFCFIMCPFCQQKIFFKISEQINNCIREQLKPFNLYRQINIKCPYINCEQCFFLTECPGCKHLVFSRENAFLDGKVITCQNTEVCGINFVFIKCTLCHSKYQELYQTQPIDINKRTICKGCKKLFLPSDNLIYEIYSNNLSVLLPIKGTPLFEGIPYQDRNIIEVEEKLIQTEQYKNLSQILNNNSSDLVQYFSINNTTTEKEIKKCMICKSIIGESVFAPCGHRCACYPCAMRYFEAQRRCPKCQARATSICRKVYG